MRERQATKAIAAAVDALNSKQRAAYNEPGNTVLLAGPGSGKTATLVLRVASLLADTPPPHGVACLTYSTEAAREFERRLRDLGVRASGRLFTGTVHAFCLAQVLKPFAYLLEPDEQFFANSEIADEKQLSRARQKGLEAAGIKEDEIWWSASIATYRRLALVDPSLAEQLHERLPTVCSVYADELRAVGKIDFDDIIFGALSLVIKNKHVGRALVAKYPWFVIDEYQDLGLALHRIVTTLIDNHDAKVFAVGDPDQSIYAFQGARPEFLEELAERSDVAVHRLELNYRCCQEIIDASLHVLQASQERKFTASQTDTRGELIFKRCPSGLEEQAAYVIESVQRHLDAGLSPGDIVVLAARWGDLYALEEPLTEAGIPYRLVRSREYRSTPLTTWVEDVATRFNRNDIALVAREAATEVQEAVHSGALERVTSTTHSSTGRSRLAGDGDFAAAPRSVVSAALAHLECPTGAAHMGAAHSCPILGHTSHVRHDVHNSDVYLAVSSSRPGMMCVRNSDVRLAASNPRPG